MYTVVMMAALGTNVDLPACGWGRGYDSCGWGYSGCGWGYGRWGYGGYWNGCCNSYYYNPCCYATAYSAPYAGQVYLSSAVTVDNKMPATMIVDLPAEANLTIDGEATHAASSQRTFSSPPLQPGKTYSYTLQAEVTRNGQKSTVVRNVDVRAGQVSRISLAFPTQTARK
jgi:uncharacterized protein (TIGR03000 family)